MPDAAGLQPPVPSPQSPAPLARLVMGVTGVGSRESPLVPCRQFPAISNAPLDLV